MSSLPDGNDLEQFMNTAGEAHSFQDGALFGVIAALTLTSAELLTVVAMLLGLGGAKVGRKRILSKSRDLLRMDDITTNPEYAVLGFVAGFVPTAVAVVLGSAYVGFL